MKQKTMADTDFDQIDDFLAVHDRWASPFLEAAKEQPDEYNGLILVDTYPDDGDKRSMITPRTLDDIDQLKNLTIREIRLVDEDDPADEYVDCGGVPGESIVIDLMVKRKPRITPRTDLKAREIPPKW